MPTCPSCHVATITAASYGADYLRAVGVAGALGAVAAAARSRRPSVARQANAVASGLDVGRAGSLGRGATHVLKNEPPPIQRGRRSPDRAETGGDQVTTAKTPSEEQASVAKA